MKPVQHYLLRHPLLWTKKFRACSGYQPVSVAELERQRWGIDWEVPPRTEALEGARSDADPLGEDCEICLSIWRESLSTRLEVSRREARLRR